MGANGDMRGNNGSPSHERIQTTLVSSFHVADELEYGVYISCDGKILPADLIEGLCNLLAQITRAALSHPAAARAADLGLKLE